jgi:hypothetical protein
MEAIIALNCPNCNFKNSYNSLSHIEGKKLTCLACHKLFQQLTCPKCRRTNYFKDANYTEGLEYSCQYCQAKFQQISCPNCSGFYQ